MTDFWTGKRVVVTGGTGFLGGHLCAKLKRLGVRVHCVGGQSFDLLDEGQAWHLFEEIKTDVVFHLAANVGGIGYNQAHPATLLHQNAMMALNVLSALAIMYENRVRVVLVGSTCAYPRDCPVPFKETSLFDGYPEGTNAPYGIAKRMMMVYADALGKQHGLNWTCAIPTNLYGERDCFDPDRSHVIPALMRKMAENPTEITVWGTGNATRDFLYAGDCADGLLALAERGQGVVNLGSGREIAINHLVLDIAEAMDWSGRIRWDESKPDGQPRRLLDITRARELGWSPKTPLAEGLQRTADWYKDVPKLWEL